MATRTELTVGRLDAAAGRDARLVDELTRLINDVYAVAERGLWQDGATRTTPTELADLIGAGEIAVATASDGSVVGSILIHQVADDVDEFGMLVAAPDRRGTGIGRNLVEFAERSSRERGRRAMQLELLVPRDWVHPNKEFLEAWYSRIGYRLLSTRRMDEAHPHLAALLATPCDLQVREKPLDARHTT